MEIVYRKYEYMKKMMKPAELKSSTLLGSVERNIGKKAILKNQVAFIEFDVVKIIRF